MTELAEVSLNNWIHLGLVACCVASIGCRLNYMRKGTKHCISVLYILWGSIVGVSVAFPSSPLLLTMLGFTAGILASDYRKWQFAQPQYTLKQGA